MKHKLLDRMEEKQCLSGRDYTMLYIMSYSLDAMTRSEVAVLLCDHYTKMAEITLLRLTYDRDSLVRLQATDSLCIGKSNSSLKRLISLAGKEDRLLRGYAYLSLIDVLKNRNIRREKIHYFNYICERMKREKSFKVRFMVISQLYSEGYRKFWKEIKTMIDYQLKNGVTDFWLIMNVLDEIMNADNKEEIVVLLKKLKEHTVIKSQIERISYSMDKLTGEIM